MYAKKTFSLRGKPCARLSARSLEREQESGNRKAGGAWIGHGTQCGGRREQFSQRPGKTTILNVFYNLAKQVSGVNTILYSSIKLEWAHLLSGNPSHRVLFGPFTPNVGIEPNIRQYVAGSTLFWAIPSKASGFVSLGLSPLCCPGSGCFLEKAYGAFSEVNPIGSTKLFPVYSNPGPRKKRPFSLDSLPCEPFFEANTQKEERSRPR